MNTNAERMRKLDFKVKSVCIGVTVLAYVIALVIYRFRNDISNISQMDNIGIVVILYLLFDCVITNAYFDEMPKRGIGFHAKMLAVMVVMAGILAVIPPVEPMIFISPTDFGLIMVWIKLVSVIDAMVCNAYVKRCREKGTAAKNVKRVSNIFWLALSVVVGAVTACYLIFL